MPLQITRLEVEQLRRFRAPVVLEGFTPGLNIVSAPNGQGKSTLVRAIRAAFFERHRSTAVDDLRPWGEAAGVAPRIALDFRFDGTDYRLQKSFLAKKRCVLQAGTRALEGVEAEDHLAQLFGFGFAAKGASKPEHWGIPGLLWVEQGSGQELELAHAREHLHDALQGQAGGIVATLAASSGDAVLDTLRAQRDALVTSTGRPKAGSDLHQAQEAADAAAGELEALEAQLQQYRGQVDRLAALRQVHAAETAARPWEALRTQHAQAQAQQQALQSREIRLQHDASRLAQLEQQQGLLTRALELHAQQEQAARQRAQEAARTGQALQQTEQRLQAARTAAQAAEESLHAARQAAQQARQAAGRAQLQRQLASAQAEAARCTEVLARAQAAEAALQAQRVAHAQAPGITQAQLQQLERLERAQHEARLQLQSVATRLRYQLPDGQALSLQAAGSVRELAAEGELLLDAPVRLLLPGGGSLEIAPGGEELDALAQAQRQADAALAQALQAAGLADLAAAQARRQAVQQREAQIALAGQALQLAAPRGLEPLRAALQAATAQASTALEAVQWMGQASADAALPLDDAEAALNEAEVRARLARETAAQAGTDHAAARGAWDAARKEQAAALAALDDPARQGRHAEAQQALLQARAEAEALAVQIAAARASLQAERPEIVAQTLARLEASIAQLQRGHQERREQILTLEGQLHSAGAQDLDERRDAAAGTLQWARRRHAELLRRVAALELLCRKLEAKRSRTLARLQAPLLQRLQHYLPLLLPGAAITLDAALAPQEVRLSAAGGAAEAGPLAAMSFGTREQLALICRLAYADLLQQAGRPTLLILDDALVHSDAERLAAMKPVLFDAAQRHQVLLFTCHPEWWRDMGAAIRSL